MTGISNGSVLVTGPTRGRGRAVTLDIARRAESERPPTQETR